MKKIIYFTQIFMFLFISCKSSNYNEIMQKAKNYQWHNNMTEAQKTLNSIVFKAEEVFSNCINKSREIDIASAKNTVVQLMRQYIYEITEKRPVILPVFNVIKQK